MTCENRNGVALLKGKFKAMVKYRRKRWDAKELMEFLASRVDILEKNQCEPSAKCLFEGEDYLDNKYLPEG